MASTPIRRHELAAAFLAYFLPVCVLVSCAKAPPKPQPKPAVATQEPIAERRARLMRELRSDILLSYTRADSLAFADTLVNQTLIDLEVGSARIGVGPDDLMIQPIISPRD